MTTSPMTPMSSLLSDDPYLTRINSLWDAHDNCCNEAMKNEWRSKINMIGRLHSERLLERREA